MTQNQKDWLTATAIVGLMILACFADNIFG
jgi:hypothetical protein